MMSSKPTKFGLQVRKKTKKVPSSARPSVFGGVFASAAAASSSSESRDATSERLKQTTQRQMQKAEKEKLELLGSDPNVFAYDEVYDDMKEEKEQVLIGKQSSKSVKQSRYIQVLKHHAEKRKRAQDVVYQRNIIRERKSEDHLYEHEKQPAFVTSGYKKQMIEDQKYLAQEKLEEAAKERHTVVNKKNMMGFYANLTRNIAAGGIRETKETSKRDPEKAPESSKMDIERKEDVDDRPKLPQKKKIEPEKPTTAVPRPREAVTPRDHEEAVPRRQESAAELKEKETAPVVDVQPKKRDRSDAVLSAKERYLQRKKQREREQLEALEQHS